MNARELRKSLAARYRLEEASGVLVAGEPAPFEYSDGAAAEAYLADVMREARDRAVGSEELAKRVRDWPSRYHLSPARANLLRPILPSIKGLAIEIGAGCGAITRLLGETGATVLAVEGSLARARIAAMRCKDLSNVVVVCDNFANVEPPAPADLVTLIGVLEYSRMFIPGDDPVQELLGRASRALKDDGLLAIAIENQLGVKYLAGAREDHTGLPFFGVADRYAANGPVTFGEGELRRRIHGAGFAAAEVLYPFPDYKLPSVIVTEAGFADTRLNVADLIATSMRRRDPTEGVLVYPESLARDVFIRNGLGAATANSFLALASRSKGGRMTDPGVLAFAYSTDRVRRFAKETLTIAADTGLVIRRRALYKSTAPQAAQVRQRITDEAYVSGTVLYRDLEAIMARPGWCAEDVAQWARPLVAMLLERASPDAAVAPADRALPPDYLDCTPFNVIRRERDGALAPIDLEWEWAATEPVTVARIVFRGLWNSLVRVDDVAEAMAGTPTDLYALVRDVMARLELPFDEATTLRWIQDEYGFVDSVAAAGERVPAVVPHLNVGGPVANPPRVASGLGGPEGYTASSPGFIVQAYFRGPNEGYSEANSVMLVAGGQSDRIVAHLPLPARPAGYERIRFDPMDIPGLFRLEHIALLTARGEVAWETRACRPPDLEDVQQMRDLSALSGSARGAVYFSEGIDPHVELAIHPAAMARMREGGALLVEMGRLDVAELSAIVRLALLAGHVPPPDARAGKLWR